jgi:membrane dipeptidase
VKRNYSGYRSFDYLTGGKDYQEFKLAKEIDRVPPYLVPLSAVEEERVERILAEHPVVSLHDHPVLEPADMSQVFEYKHTGRQITPYEALSRSCLSCVFDNMMDGMSFITSKSGWKWDDVVHDIGMRLSDIAHQDMIIVGRRVDDILCAHKEGKIALVLCQECATPIENELDRIDVLYGLGVRLMGLVYSESNGLGSGLKENADGGLTFFGHECVERMNKLGMAIDTAHCGDRTTLDAVNASKKPILASHVGARSLYDIKRLKTDEVLKAIADKGGLIGVEAAPHTTATNRRPDQDIESVMEHFEYIKDLVGIDHVGFGPDTNYGDHVAMHKTVLAALSINQVVKASELGRVPYVKGMENPTECSWNIPRWLVKHGYSDTDIAKAVGGNAIRVLKDIWY